MRNSRNGNGRSGRSSRQFSDQNQNNEYRTGGSQSDYRGDRGDFDMRDQGRYSDQDYDQGSRGGQYQTDEGDYDRSMRSDYGNNSYTDNEGYDQGEYRGGWNQYSQGGNSYAQGNQYSRGGYDQDFGGSDWRRHQGAGAGAGRWSGQENSRGYGQGEGSRGMGGEGYGGMSGGLNRNSGFGNNESRRSDDTNRRGTSSFDTNRSGQWGSSVESMRGKGPKGYQRSDERLQEQVNDTLTDDHMLDASGIEVTVKNGEVTLSGTVDNREAKRRAEDLVEDISGVKNVENRIRVSADKSEERGTQDRNAQESDKSRSQNKSKAHQNAEVN
jgi:hypothetical protein